MYDEMTHHRPVTHTERVAARNAHRVPDCKLFMGIHSLTITVPSQVKGSLLLHVSSGGISHSFPLVLDNKSEATKTMTFRPAISTTSLSSTGPKMGLWNLADYHGGQAVDLVLEQSRFLGMKKRRMGKGRITLRTLLSHQDHLCATAAMSTLENPFYATFTASIEPEERLLLERRSHRYGSMAASSTTAVPVTGGGGGVGVGAGSTATTSSTGKKVRLASKEFMQLNSHFSTSSTAPTHRIESTEYETVPTTGTPSVTVTLTYRVMLLRRCLHVAEIPFTIPWSHIFTTISPDLVAAIKAAPSWATPPTGSPSPPSSSLSSSSSSTASPAASSSLTPPSTTTLYVSEMHILVAFAPTPLLIEVMKTLAWRHCLDDALTSKSNGGHVPLEFALRYQQPHALYEQNNLYELLQRTGRMCFPRLSDGRDTVLHAAIGGNNAVALDLLCRFLKKYGPEFLVSDTGHPVNRHLSLSTLLEWPDHEGYTPLMLACSLPHHREQMLRTLLLAGADVAAIQVRHGYNVLSCAVVHGHAVAVDILLSLMKEPSEVMLIAVPQPMPMPMPTPAPTITPATAAAAANTGGAVAGAGMGGDLDGDDAFFAATATAAANNHVHHAAPPPALAPANTTVYQPPPDALSRHLRHNARSRHLLRDSQLETGGFFNRLALYICQPAQRQRDTGRTALHLAVLHGHVTITLQLLEIGLSLLDVDVQQEHVFHVLWHPLAIATPTATTAAGAGAAAATASLWTTRERLLQEALLPYEAERWHQYRDVVQPRSWEWMLRRQVPFLQRNVHGQHSIDLGLIRWLTTMTMTGSGAASGSGSGKGGGRSPREVVRTMLLQLVELLLSDYELPTITGPTVVVAEGNSSTSTRSHVSAGGSGRTVGGSSSSGGGSGSGSGNGSTLSPSLSPASPAPPASPSSPSSQLPSSSSLSPVPLSPSPPQRWSSRHIDRVWLTALRHVLSVASEAAAEQVEEEAAAATEAQERQRRVGLQRFFEAVVVETLRVAGAVTLGHTSTATSELVDRAVALCDSLRHVAVSLVAIALIRQVLTAVRAAVDPSELFRTPVSSPVKSTVASVDGTTTTVAATVIVENNVEDGDDDVADRADYLFALTALSLKTLTDLQSTTL